MKTVFLSSALVNGLETTTQDLIKICLNNVPKDGFTYQDIKDRGRIEEAMGKVVSESFDLEDADYKNLVACVAATRWNVRDRFVTDFLEGFLK